MKINKSMIAVSLALSLAAAMMCSVSAFAASTDTSAASVDTQAAQIAQAAPTEEGKSAETDGDNVQEENMDETGDPDNEQETQQEDAADAQAQADLAAQAAITEAEAIAAAENANPGFTFTVEELDSENGTVAYNLKGTDASGAGVEVKVNATDGTVMQEAEND
ncbi:MAG: PepSY domain-containing protein [Pygmaiobacter sp.]|nr:PepSY domain-containing protein [Pygmaiobacter sp.]